MVHITTFALLFLSATSSVLGARRHHGRKRSSVCKPKAVSTSTVVPTVTPAAADVITSTQSRFKTVSTTSPKATQSASSDDTSDNTGDNSTSSDTGSSNAYFPVSSKISAGWTVAAAAAVPNVQTQPLTKNSFIVTKQTPTTIWEVGQYQGKTAVKTTYNKGSVDPGTQPEGGFSFYTPGLKSSSSSNVPIVDLSKGKELLFTYSVQFQSGFDFNLGGKMPGFYGGTDPTVAATCSGGKHDPDCWSARLMFRPKGAGELYLYIPPGLNDNNNKCGKSASNKCPDTGYGNSAGTGTWYWTPGKWQTVSQRLLLNTPGKADGEAEIYVDGQSVLKVDTITWRTNAEALTRGIQMQTFFGGHTGEWASPQTQDAYFADFSVAILQSY